MSTFKSILIVGSGNIGSRHLQSLANLNNSFLIYVFDINPLSTQKSFSLYQSISKPSSPSVKILESLDFLPNNIDLLILATDSFSRREVFESLLKITKIKFIIFEKFLFQYKNDYLYIESELSKNNIKAWVNTPFRTMDSYRELKNSLSGETISSINVSGFNWGMASNIVHYLDLIYFLTTENGFFNLNFDFVEKLFYESKRKNYLELFGTIIGSINNIFFSISCFKGQILLPKIQIITESRNILIDEQSKRINIFQNITETINSNPFFIPFQSQLTSSYVEEIFRSGTCKLPKFEISTYIHLTFMESLINFQKNIKKDSPERCIIT